MLMVTTAGPAAAGLASSFIAVKYLGLAAFGQWLAWRSLFLLAAIPTPGFNIAQQVLVAEALAKGDTARAHRVQRYCDRQTVVWVLVFSTITLVAAVVYGIRPFKAFCLATLFSGLFLAAYTTSQIIGNKDTVRTVRGGIADVLGAVGTILAAFTGNLNLFILSMGLRYWIKGAVQYAPLPKGLDFTSPEGENLPEETRKVGIPLMLRAFVRDASQYGDKPILGRLYTTTIAGVAGVGSILATIAVMLANTASSYLLPVLIEADPKDHARLCRSSFLKVLHAIIIFALFIPISAEIDPGVALRLDLVGLTYFIIAALSLLSPLVVPWTARGEIWRGTIVTGVVIGIVACVMIGFGLAKGSVRDAMMISTYIVFFSVAWTLRETKIVSMSLLTAFCASMLAATLAVGFSWAVSLNHSLPVAIIVAALGVAYAVVAAWGPIRRRLFKSSPNEA